MKYPLKVSLVVPVYNNEKTAIVQLKLCDKILNKITLNYEIIVCDDKSTDMTALLLKNNFQFNPNFKLFFNQRNLGITGNIRNLYNKAKYDYIVLFSVDGDWDPEDIERLLFFANNNIDIVVGKRTYRNYSSYRKIISFLYNFLIYLLFQVKTMDAGSIKVIRKELFLNTPLISKSIFFEAELIIRTIKNGGKASSIPVSFSKLDKKGSSGGNLALVLASFRDLINLRLKI